MQLPRELLGLLEIIHGPALHQPAFMALRPAIPRHLQPTGHAQLATIKKAPRLESKQPARGASATAGPADNAAKLSDSARATHIPETMYSGKVKACPARGGAVLPDSNATQQQVHEPDTSGEIAHASLGMGPSTLDTQAEAEPGRPSGLPSPEPAGQQGVLGKQQRKEKKRKEPEGPSSGLGFWLQMRQAAGGKDGRNGPSQAGVPASAVAHAPSLASAAKPIPAPLMKSGSESGGSQQLLSDDSAMLAKQRHPPLSRAHKRHPISTGLQQEGQGKGGLVSRPISADQQPTDSTVLRQAARGQEGVRLPARPCDSDADAASDSSSDSGEDESMMGGVGPHKRPSHVQVGQ